LLHADRLRRGGGSGGAVGTGGVGYAPGGAGSDGLSLRDGQGGASDSAGSHAITAVYFPAGTYTLSFTATGGPVTHTVQFVIR
jgi:hypothetical protein